MIRVQRCDNVVHLEGAQTQLDEDPSLSSCVFREEGKHHVVHPEQGDEQQRGLGQSPAGTAKSIRTRLSGRHTADA